VYPDSQNSLYDPPYTEIGSWRARWEMKSMHESAYGDPRKARTSLPYNREDKLHSTSTPAQTGRAPTSGYRWPTVGLGAGFFPRPREEPGNGGKPNPAGVCIRAHKKVERIMEHFNSTQRLCPTRSVFIDWLQNFVLAIGLVD
jgi:hypothetical protein